MRTPALIVDLEALEANIRTMAAARPGAALRPHVKAHKCTSLARRQRELGGHTGFTCATIREVEGLAGAGLGEDLLLANEVLDCTRLGTVVDAGARVTVAVDSEETIDAAAAGGVRDVLIDVNVGLPRCGCAPGDAGRLADLARRKGLTVRGVMGYEGHATAVHSREGRMVVVDKAMALLRTAHEQVGGDIISAGSTVTYDLNRVATEIQAGSYALMDSYFAPMTPEFRQALFLEATVISVSATYAVADVGLKALGMDHGPPTLHADTPGDVLIVSDEHLTFVPADSAAVQVGDRIKVVPAHVDPTVAYHEHLHVSNGDVWEVDLRGW